MATSSLTFFQQIGGTVGLTIAGTVFASRLTKEIPTQLLAAGVPQQFVDQFAGGQSVDVTGTGDLGERILAACPRCRQAAARAADPRHRAARSTRPSRSRSPSTFWVGIVGALIGAVVVLLPSRGADARDLRVRGPGAGGGRLTRVRGRTPKIGAPPRLAVSPARRRKDHMPFSDMAERLVALRTPGEIAIAPDGETVVFSLHPAAADAGSHLPSELWLLRGDGPATLLTDGSDPGLVARRRQDRVPARTGRRRATSCRIRSTLGRQAGASRGADGLGRGGRVVV